MASTLAMASTPFPIVLHDHTKAGIRWWVSIHPELSAESTVVVRWPCTGGSEIASPSVAMLWRCCTAMDPRHERLAELRHQLAELDARRRQTAPGSPEREEVLEQWAPVHAAVLALAKELEGEESEESDE